MVKLLVGFSRLKKSLAIAIEVKERPQRIVQEGAEVKALKRTINSGESCIRVVMVWIKAEMYG